MLTRFVRNQLIIFTIASIVGVTVMLFAYMQVPTLLDVGRIDCQAGTACRRRSLPVRQRHLPRRADRQGQVGGAHRERRRSDAVAQHVAEDPRGPRGQRAQRVGGRRAVRGPAAAHRLRPVPGGRFGDRGDRHHDPAAGRPDAGSGQRAGEQHPRATGSADLLDETFKAFNGAGLRLRLAARLRCDTVRATQQRLRPDARR